jgi:hypothetical protein
MHIDLTYTMTDAGEIVVNKRASHSNRAVKLPFVHSITSLLSSVSIFVSWKMNSGTELLDIWAGAGTAAAGFEIIGTGAESKNPDGPKDEEATGGLLGEVSLSGTEMLVCGVDGLFESRVELETMLLLVSGHDVCSCAVS